MQLQSATQKNPSKGYMALHKFVEKVAIFMLVTNNTINAPDDVADILLNYATLVSEQGLFVNASKYCR